MGPARAGPARSATPPAQNPAWPKRHGFSHLSVTHSSLSPRGRGPTRTEPLQTGPTSQHPRPASARSPRAAECSSPFADSHGPHVRPSFFLAPRPLLPGPPPLRALPCCWPRSTPRPSLADPTPAQSTPLLLEASPGSDRTRSRVLCAIPAPRLPRDPHAEADPPLLKRHYVPAGSHLRRSHRPNHESSTSAVEFRQERRAGELGARRNYSPPVPLRS